MASFGQPTIIDVASRAGVSNMTVSRVVRQRGYVSDKTRKKVEAAIEELGYRPNALAKSMRTNATHNIGFMLPDLTNMAHAAAAQAAEGILAQQGYQMVLSNSRFSPDTEAKFLAGFQQHTVDGVIAIITDETRERVQQLIEKSRVPIVVIDSDINTPVDTVFSEDAHCVRDVVKHLAGLGHQRISLLTTPLTTRAGRLGHQAYLDALEEQNLSHDPTLVRLRHQISSNGYQAALELVRLPDRPTALIVAANQLGLGALRAIKDSGLKVPNDISMVGVDEGDISAIVDPPLTVISRDMPKVGTHAANLLLERLSSKSSSPSHATVRSEVILRQSCAKPPRA